MPVESNQIARDRAAWMAWVNRGITGMTRPVLRNTIDSLSDRQLHCLDHLLDYMLLFRTSLERDSGT